MENGSIVIRQQYTRLFFEIYCEQKSIIPYGIDLATSIIQDGLEFNSRTSNEYFEASKISFYAFNVSFSLEFINEKKLNNFINYLRSNGFQIDAESQL